MIEPAKLTYSGLTIVLDHPSRFDLQSKKLLTGTGGLYFCNDCLYPQGMNRYMCDVITLDSITPDWRPRPATKCILTLGEKSMRQLGGVTTTLNEQRGSPILREGWPPIIASYIPQVAKDKKNYEAIYNPQAKDEILIQEEGGDDKRRHGITNQKNFKFWLKKDVEKAVNVLNGIRKAEDANYTIYPDGDMVFDVLVSNTGKYLYFDIETDQNLNIICFSFSFDIREVFVVPVVDYNYHHAYSDLPRIFAALAYSIKRNTLVAHNGSGFDFLVLGHKYRIPVYKVYDTMLAQSRCFPGVEKSLGHCISMPWMMEPYHKDEALFSYNSESACMQLWRYCGKDVSSLIHLKAAQDEYARKHVGIRESIDAVNSYVPAYVNMTLTGIRYDNSIVESIWKENDAKCMALLKVLNILVGPEWLKKIRGAGKSPMLNSPKQCARYFYELLKYPVVSKTKTGAPAGDKKALYKLKLKFNNPVIDVACAYRSLIKDSGSLKFIPFKD